MFFLVFTLRLVCSAALFDFRLFVCQRKQFCDKSFANRNSRNIVETSWRKLKYKWLSPLDYQSKENFFYQIRLALKEVEETSFITIFKI